MWIPPGLFSLIKQLYTDNFGKVKWGPGVETKEDIPIRRDVRQGCFGTYTLFIIYQQFYHFPDGL